MKRLMIALVCLVLMGCVTGGSENISGWSFVDGGTSPKRYAYSVVSKAEGHPVRSGETSMRFEVRDGDCGSYYDWDDCSTHRERKELRQGDNINVGENWYHWSLYLPKDFRSVWPVKLNMGQFHVKGSLRPAFMFLDKVGKYQVHNMVGHYMVENKPITISEMRGRWTDILVHVKWTRGENGFFRVYANGDDTPSYYYAGVTSPKRNVQGIFFKFGIYRSNTHYWFLRDKPDAKVPTQIVYYDDVRRGSACEEVTEYFDCARLAATAPGVRG